MVTENALKKLAALFNIAAKFKLLPFKWNSKLYQLRTLKTWLERSPAYLIVFILVFQTIFGIINFYIKLPKLSTQTTVLYVFWNLMFFTGAICSILNLKKNSAFRIAINQFFGVYELMLGQGLVINKTLVWRLKAYVLSFAMAHLIKFCALESLALAIYFMGHSNKVWYLSSNFQFSWLTFPFFVVFEYFQVFFVFCTLLYSAVPIMFYWFCMATWLSNLKSYAQQPCKPNTEKPGKNSMAMELPAKVPCYYNPIQLYRICYLLNKDFNIWYANGTMLLIQFGATIFSVILLHVLIRFYDTLPVMMITFMLISSGVILVFVAIIYPLASDIHSNSKAFKQSLIKATTLQVKLQTDKSENNDNNIMRIHKQQIAIRRKDIRSIAFMKVELGATFMHKGKVCAIYNSIFYWTIRSVILANKQKPNAANA